MFHGQINEAPVAASSNMDVSDVARNVASMGRLLRAGFDLHLRNRGHTCWMEKCDQKTTISEDNTTSKPPLYSLDVAVLPPPWRILQWRNRSSCEGRSHRCGERTIGGRSQSGIGRSRAIHGSEWLSARVALLHGERWLIAMPGGRRVNVKMSNIKRRLGCGSFSERGNDCGSTERSGTIHQAEQ